MSDDDRSLCGVAGCLAAATHTFNADQGDPSKIRRSCDDTFHRFRMRQEAEHLCPPPPMSDEEREARLAEIMRVDPAKVKQGKLF